MYAPSPNANLMTPPPVPPSQAPVQPMMPRPPMPAMSAAPGVTSFTPPAQPFSPPPPPSGGQAAGLKPGMLNAAALRGPVSAMPLVSSGASTGRPLATQPLAYVAPEHPLPPAPCRPPQPPLLSPGDTPKGSPTTPTPTGTTATTTQSAAAPHSSRRNHNSSPSRIRMLVRRRTKACKTWAATSKTLLHKRCRCITPKTCTTSSIRCRLVETPESRSCRQPLKSGVYTGRSHKTPLPFRPERTAKVRVSGRNFPMERRSEFGRTASRVARRSKFGTRTVKRSTFISRFQKSPLRSLLPNRRRSPSPTRCLRRRHLHLKLTNRRTTTLDDLVPCGPAVARRLDDDRGHTWRNWWNHRRHRGIREMNQ